MGRRRLVAGMPLAFCSVPGTNEYSRVISLFILSACPYFPQAEVTRGSQRSLLALEGGARRGLAATDNSTTPADYWGFGPYKNCGKLCQVSAGLTTCTPRVSPV